MGLKKINSRIKVLVISAALLILSSAVQAQCDLPEETDLLSPSLLLQNLQSVAGAEDVSWITQSNLPVVRTEHGHIHSMLIESAIVKLLADQNLPSSDESLEQNATVQCFFKIFNYVGEASKELYGPNYEDSFNNDSGLLNDLNAASILWEDTFEEQYFPQYGSRRYLAQTWDRYKVAQSLIDIAVAVQTDDDLALIRSIYDIVGVVGGYSGAAAGAYMKVLFDAIEGFQDISTKSRIALTTSLYFAAKQESHFSSYFNVETYPAFKVELRPSGELYSYLSQPSLGSTANLDDHSNRVVVQHIGIGDNVDVLPSVIQDALLFISPSLITFIEKYKDILQESGASSWAELHQNMESVLASEIQRANNIRDDYRNLNSGNIQISTPDDDNFVWVINNGSQNLKDVFIRDYALIIDEDSTKTDIGAGGLGFVDYSGLDGIDQIHYKLFGGDDHIVLGSEDVQELIAYFVTSPDELTIYRDVQFNSLSNAIAYNANETVFAWNFGDGNNGSGRNPAHRYAAPGTYSVTLVITKNFEDYVFTQDVTILDNPEILPSKPLINRFPGGSSYDLGEQIRLTASSQSSDANEPITYYWYLEGSQNDPGASFAQGEQITVAPTTGHEVRYYVRAENVYGSSELSSTLVVINGGNINPSTALVLDENVTHDVCGEVGSVILRAGTLDISNCDLRVRGQFIHEGGILNVGSGLLTVDSDYRSQSISEGAQGAIEYSESSAFLKMLDENGHMLVKGNFLMDSLFGGTLSNCNNVRCTYAGPMLKEGLLEVRGNFTQMSSHDEGSSSDATLPAWNFNATDNHKVLLSGVEKQFVSFADPGTQTTSSAPNSHFNILEITNSSNDGVEFTTATHVSKLFEHNRSEFSLLNGGQFVDYDQDTHLDHLDSYPTDPTKWVFDWDEDGIPDDLDPDDDNDDVLDENDAFPRDPNEWADNDADGVGDNADLDDDDDEVVDTVDNCPLIKNTDQMDTDGDLFGDNCDNDQDNDGVLNGGDDDPLDPFLCEDSDFDSCNDCAIGNDGFGGLPDNDPLNDGLDTDSNGQCNIGDLDDDNDGVLDEFDNCPLIPNADQADEDRFQDGEGGGDVCEIQDSELCIPIKAKNNAVTLICL